jgi:hypothetical protein
LSGVLPTFLLSATTGLGFRRLGLAVVVVFDDFSLGLEVRNAPRTSS